ncbi:MAG: flagellar biosynthetic protein FliO [Lachnospiraceae bacterium]|nr:flagellar biosynthetic protein FliO [Lachnospiraceae bacterium]
MLIAQTGGLDSVVRLITVFLLFLFVLGITYVTSRYVAGFQKKRMGSANLSVVEAARISPNVVLEIVRAGNKYLLIAIAKDGVTLLGELDEDSLVFGEGAAPMPEQFGEILGRAALALKKKGREEKAKEDGSKQ